MKRRINRLKLLIRRPQFALAGLLAIAMLYLVLIPLITMITETLKVHPEDLAVLWDHNVGDWTLHHYQSLFKGRTATNKFWEPLKNTLILSLGVSALGLTIGGTLAWLVTRTDLAFKKVISNLAILPYVMPSYALALAWIALFKNQRLGGAPCFLQAFFGINVPNWLSSGLVPMIITIGVHYFPFAFLLIGSALKSLDAQLEEAAFLQGASRGLVVRKIVIPLMMPAVLSAMLLTFARGRGTFGTPHFLGGPVRVRVLSTIMWAELSAGRYGTAYLIGLVLMALGDIILFLNQRVIGRRRSYTTITGKGQMARLQSLGKWRMPISYLVLIFVLLVTCVPLLILTLDSLVLLSGRYTWDNLTLQYWIGERRYDLAGGAGDAGILRNPQTVTGLWNSLKLGLTTGVICSILGILIGYVVVRYRGRFISKTLDQLSFAPYLFPSIAFGAIYLSLFGRARGPIPALYGTFTILVLVCVVKYLPYASRAGTTAMLQLGRELEEAAEMTGAGWFRRMTRIILPLQKSAVGTGILLPFISAMRELSLLVLLVTPATPVATTLTIRYTERGWYQYSNAIMLVIVFVVVASTLLMNKLMKTDLAKGIGG